jgi:hypothetical protein
MVNLMVKSRNGQITSVNDATLAWAGGGNGGKDWGGHKVINEWEDMTGENGQINGRINGQMTDQIIYGWMYG